LILLFFFSSRRRHTRSKRDWSSDVCSSDLNMNIQILADSACDLSEKHYHDLNIKMVPLTVRLDGKEYKDGKNISPKAVYDAMRNGKKPTTSQVSPQSFKAIFTSYAETNQ